jgi:HD superfamily phosphohydrolase
MIRDPVHGDIRFTKNESFVIDSFAVQRLRGVKQLGTTYLIYPGATHTRFEHSLGTGYLTKKIIENIRMNGFEIDSETEEIVSIAGIIHDITHVPYGHTFEDERKIFPRHDKKENFISLINNSDVGEKLEKLGIKDQILKILIPSDPTRKSNEDPWKNQIINDTICADLLDYLRRDCYYTGINKNYDDRVYSSFIVEDGKLVINFLKKGMERLDARSEILHLLRLRYFLTERVYFHHAKLASGAMISKAVELALKEGVITREQLYLLNDWSLLQYLKGFPKPRSEESPIKLLIHKLERRDILKRAYILSSATLSSRKNRDEFIKKYNPATKEREEVENLIINQLQKKYGNKSIGKADVVIHCLDSTYLKEAEVLIKTKDEKIVQLNKRPYPSVDIKAIEDAYEDLWRMYVFADKKYAQDVSEICENIFGKENEYNPKI